MIQINNTRYGHFLQQADAFRRAGSLCDLTVSVGSLTFRAHRLVLACASGKLARQFGRSGEDGPLRCSLDLFSPHTFQQVLDFTYGQTLAVPADDLAPLLRAAQLLEMRPLEEQCRRQLDALGRGETGETGESARGPAAETSGGEEGSPVPEEKPQRSSPPVEQDGKDVLPSSAAERPTSPTRSRKRSRPSYTPSVTYTRDSVISHPSLSCPRALCTNKWHPSTARRRMARSYSSLLAAHALPPAHQGAAYPLATYRMYPLLASSFVPQVRSALVGYPGLGQGYPQPFSAGSPAPGDTVKQDLEIWKNPSHRATLGAAPAGEQRYAAEEKARRGSAPNCQHCGAGPHMHTSGEVCQGPGCCGGLQRVAEKPYRCQHCPKRFSLKHQLDTHHRVHTGEKPFECRLCGQRSRDYSAMIKHLRTHGGAMPYQCTACLEFCSSLAAMQKHLRSHSAQDFPSNWSISSTYLYTSHT